MTRTRGVCFAALLLAGVLASLQAREPFVSANGDGSADWNERSDATDATLRREDFLQQLQGTWKSNDGITFTLEGNKWSWQNNPAGTLKVVGTAGPLIHVDMFLT